MFTVCRIGHVKGGKNGIWGCYDAMMWIAMVVGLDLNGRMVKTNQILDIFPRTSL